MNFDLSWLTGEKGQLLLAGALGGIVRWLTLRDHWLDGLISIVVGAICSVMASPLAIPALAPVLGNVGITYESTTSLSGFLLGIGGITFSGFLIDLWRIRWKLLKAAKTDQFTGGIDHDGGSHEPDAACRKAGGETRRPGVAVGPGAADHRHAVRRRLV